MKKKKNKVRLKSLLKRLVVHRLKIGLIFVCLIFTAVFMFVQPLIIRSITDDGMSARNFNVILWLSLLLLGIAALEEIFNIIQSRLFVELQNKIQFSLYMDSFKKLLHLKASYFNDKNSAEIINRISTDIGTVSTIADRGVLYVVSFLLSIIGGLVGLFIINWKMAIIVVLVVPIKYMITKVMSAKQEYITEKYIDLIRNFSSWFGDHINGIREIKLWNLQKRKFDEFLKKQERIIEANKDISMIDAYNSAITSFLEGVITSALYIVGGFMLCRNAMTIGGVIAFITYSGQVTGPISSILQIRMMFARIAPSMNRLFDFLELEEENNVGENVISAQSVNQIAMNSVAFSYETERKLLKDVTFFASSSEKIAIIGPNGSGKTTIINLLLRFIAPQSGNIQINGEDANKIDLDAYRDLFGVVSQDPYLFQDSIQNNIDLNKMAEPEDIQGACEQSGLNTFLSKLSDGLNSLVGQDGANLSGGERQKLAVARAIIKDAPIIVFDEATSNFDVESDAFLHDVMMREFKDKIVILITHNYQNLYEFDRVYRLEDGVLFELSKTELPKYSEP